MKPALHFTVLTLLLASILAGCLGSDDLIDDQDGGGGSAEGLGTVQGTILTTSLDPVRGATIQLVQNNEVVFDQNTNDQGRYTIRNVEPGEYRVHITAACCRENVAAVTVGADETATVDVQLVPWTDDDLERPRVERYEWTGFLACTLRFLNPEGPHHDVNVLGIPGGVSGVNACGLVDVVTDDILGAGNATDDDFLRTFEIRPGLKTIVVGMDWRAPGAALGDELALMLEVNGRPNLPPRYGQAEGHSPLEFRADAGEVIERYDEEDDEGTNIHQYDFENIESSLELMFRIFAGGDFNLVYQQQVTVYYDLYYWNPAPEGATALPDL